MKLSAIYEHVGASHKSPRRAESIQSSASTTWRDCLRCRAGRRAPRPSSRARLTARVGRMLPQFPFGGYPCPVPQLIGARFWPTLYWQLVPRFHCGTDLDASMVSWSIGRPSSIWCSECFSDGTELGWVERMRQFRAFLPGTVSSRFPRRHGAVRTFEALAGQ